MHRSFQRAATAGATCLIAGAAVIALPTAAQADEAPKTPKNLILLIGDGMGYNHVDLANVFEAGTSQNQVSVDPATGEVVHHDSVATQGFEDWPVRVGQSHYAANGVAEYVTEDAWSDFDQVKQGATDSAAAGTALGTGVKTNNGMIGVDAQQQGLLNLTEQAEAVGKSTGVVSSVPFSHATPSAFVAHNSDRNNLTGIAKEMFESDLEVVIGAGHPNFTDDNTSRTPNYQYIGQPEFEALQSGASDWSFIEQNRQFEQLASGEDVPERVFGIAQVATTLQQNRAGGDEEHLPGEVPFNDVPALATLATGALNVLDQNEEGFFTMIEGGAIDWTGHANQTGRTIEEQQDFNGAIEAVTEWVETESSWEETLVVVTADHETGYLAGGGAGETWTPITGEPGEMPDASWHSGNHTNALVPVYAKGAGSEAIAARATNWDLVRGAYLDNTDIGEVFFDLIGHAATDGADGGIGVTAQVESAAPAGTLALDVADFGGAVAFEDAQGRLRATLPTVNVTDTRSEVDALGRGWTVSGQAADFRAGNRAITSDHLGWTPRVLDGSAAAGAAVEGALDGGQGLGEAAVLASADRETRLGSTAVDADLELGVPADAKSGNYGSTITVTLFAQD
ncbi:alkaline phosphatase [Arenivirga flava]|uniref:Alkaline phosphatase n=1 Tax=Arenivirga flava TaxID=1930060 RepID=A0AA37URI8_9MICO|nr:alkaline phosphatase [Arenivirga flava]GMA27367.1 hypothetical protein GCM10025874_06200 [Arenivirga flava]